MHEKGGGGLSDGTIRSRVERLRRSRIFHGVSDQALAQLAREAGELEYYAADSDLYKKGSKEPHALFIWEGQVRVRRGRPPNDFTLRILDADHVIGLSIICDRARSASVVTAKKTSVLKIPRVSLEALALAEPQFALNVIAHLSELLAQVSDELERMATLPLVDRLKHAIQRANADGNLHLIAELTQDQFAVMLGCSRRRLAKALHELGLSWPLHPRAI